MNVAPWCYKWDCIYDKDDQLIISTINIMMMMISIMIKIRYARCAVRCSDENHQYNQHYDDHDHHQHDHHQHDDQHHDQDHVCSAVRSRGAASDMRCHGGGGD